VNDNGLSAKHGKHFIAEQKLNYLTLISIGMTVSNWSCNCYC